MNSNDVQHNSYILDWRFWASSVCLLLAIVMTILLFINGQIEKRYDLQVVYIMVAAMGYVNAQSIMRGKTDRITTILAALALVASAMIIFTMWPYITSM